MKTNIGSEECKETEKHFAALSDDELQEVTGGRAQPPVSPVAGPPLCFCGKRSQGFGFAPARCTPFSACPYYDDCVNPDRKKRKDSKRK